MKVPALAVAPSRTRPLWSLPLHASRAQWRTWRHPVRRRAQLRAGC